MVSKEGSRQPKNRLLSMSKEGQNFRFSSHSNLDSVLWLRRLALDPCKLKLSMEDDKKSHHDVLKIRKLMFLGTTKAPQKKRKVGASLREAIDQQVASKFPKEHLSHTRSKSYLLKPIDSGESLHRQVVDNLHSTSSVMTLEEKQMNLIEPATIGSFPLADSDESVNHESTLGTRRDPTHKSDHLLDADGQSSYPLGLAEPKASSFPKLAIPVGPRFQVEVPPYTSDKGKIKRYKCQTENSKWLGRQIWPIENGCRGGNRPEMIGRGRPSFCSCEARGSSYCSNLHVHESRLDLLDELGPAFITWKFDDMGQEVSKSWTLKEQKSFAILRQKYLGDESLFWEQASKCLPLKCKTSILSYYFNVFIPKRLSVETKFSTKLIYSDDEEPEEDDRETKGSRRKGKSKDGALKKPIDVKRQYMRRVR